MKTRGLFLSALMMGAVMAGCSNEDVLNDIQSEKKNGQHESYMAINIVSSDATGSRAAGEEFKSGSEAEQAVNDLVLVFFKADGSFYDAQEKDFSFTATAAEAETSIESKSDIVVVFEGDQVKPASFVALINTGIDASTFIEKETTMADVQDMITDYKSTATVNEVETDFFVMSNSVYSDGSIQVAAPITDEMICSTRDAAEKNPAIAYVERVAAKLEAKASAELTVEGKEVNLDGNNITLIPTITGMKFVHTNPYSYLLKNINGISEDWSDAANFRSYWANSYVSDNVENYTYNTYSYNDAIANGAGVLTEYANENTSSTATKLMVTATIKAEKDKEPVDIYKYKGYYYTEEGLKKEIASILKGKELKYTLDETEGDNWANYITVTHPEGVEQWEGTIGVTEDITVTDEVAAEIAKLEKVRWWNDGKCYFFVDVEHESNKSGVVRNHWYNLTINSISGLGTPVADPNDDIVPEKLEDEQYFVAAQVQILKWKMVNQEVALN